jgi:hypothetical protein
MYEHAGIFVNNYFKFGFLGISYNAILHKYGFGQAYCKDLLKGNPRKFILYFSELYTNCYEIWKFILFSGIYLNGNGNGKDLMTPPNWAQGLTTGAWPTAPRPTVPTPCSGRGHRAA